VGYSLRGAQNVLPQVASGAESASPRRFALAPAGRCQQLHRVIKQRVVVIVGDAEASAPGVPQVVVPGALVPVEPERPVVGMPRRRRHRKRKRANLPIHVIREAAGRASTSAAREAVRLHGACPVAFRTRHGRFFLASSGQRRSSLFYRDALDSRFALTKASNHPGHFSRSTEPLSPLGCSRAQASRG
jgi:hypothetical protein